MSSKIACGISLITNKSIVGIILTLVIICSTYFHNSNADISSLILLVIFISFIPLISSKFKNINDIPPLTYLISYLIGLLVSVAFNIDMLISAILACFSINMLILFLIDRKYGIDINTHGIAEALCILTIFIGPDAGFLAMLYPLSMWSRLKLDENSIFWENALGLLGLFVTAIIMYILLQYHFFLEVLVTDYAISILTLVFSIIYYYEIDYDARLVFAVVFCITFPPTSLAPTSLWAYGITMFTLLFIVLAKNVTISN